MMYRSMILSGLVCFVVQAFGGTVFERNASELVGYSVWLGLATVLAAWCAYREPRIERQAGAWILLVQLGCGVFALRIPNPGRPL